MKRNKHILINLSEDQYNKLLFIATNQRRKISDAAYLILIDNIASMILKLTDLNRAELTQPTFINE